MTSSSPFIINHHLSLPDLVEWLNLRFTWKSFTLVRWDIKFFTEVQVADLRVPQTLLAPLTVSLGNDAVALSISVLLPASFDSWEGAAAFSERCRCWACLGLLRGARLPRPDLGWTLRLDADV